MKAIYAGSFDPITNGHIDIINRATVMFDKVYVGVASNSNKDSFFDIEIRKTLAQECLKGFSNVEVVTIEGLVVDYARENKIGVMIRGLRAVSDFEYEFQIATTNKILNPNVETMFLMSDHKYQYLSSSLTREIAKYNGDLSSFVSPNVARALKKAYE